MHSVRLNILSLKYQRFLLLGRKDIGIRKFKFVAKNQFLFEIISKKILIARSFFITETKIIQLFTKMSILV